MGKKSSCPSVVQFQLLCDSLRATHWKPLDYVCLSFYDHLHLHYLHWQFQKNLQVLSIGTFRTCSLVHCNLDLVFVVFRFCASILYIIVRVKLHILIDTLVPFI